ncbi:MAG: hypothetical protein PHO86_05490 [Bacilli bacterium]|nr:hypothetical protein [Bacilli bacterium]
MVKDYNETMHKHGRIYLAIAIFIMLAIPTTMCLVLNVSPIWSAMFTAILTVSILNIPGGFVEVGTYGPLIGTSATYLAFVTGNLVNLKVPCAANAQAVAKTTIGTPENEVVSTLAVGTSTIVNSTIMTLGVILLVPLSPILTSKVLEPAFAWVVPALFGALGYKYFRDIPLLGIIVFLLSTVGALVLPKIANDVSIYIIICVALSLVIARILYVKKVI